MVRRILKLEVKDVAEFAAIKRALEMPEIRAFVTIIGHLEPLSDRARARVLRFTADSIDEQITSGAV